MALPIGIKELLDGQLVESSRIEYKKSWAPDEALKTITAFANDIDNMGGGYVVFGVFAPKGYPTDESYIGIAKDEIDRVERDIVNKCSLIVPRYFPTIETAEYHGVNLIILFCPPGIGRPYKSPLWTTDKKKKDAFYYWIRKGSVTCRADENDLKALFEVSMVTTYDEQPCVNASIEDISLPALRSHLKQTGSKLYEQSETMPVKTLAAQMNLLTGPVDHLYPKNVAILMFSENPQRYFPSAYIEYVNLPTPDGKQIQESYFKGPIQLGLKEALNALKPLCEKTNIFKKPDEPEAKRLHPYPYAAVEEILTNAVFHKDYRIQEPITITETPTYLEVRSYPGFDRTIKAEAIARGEIQSLLPYRNRSIGAYLKELRLTEGRNTGFPLAFAALKENDSLPPLIQMDDERTSLRIRLYKQRSFFSEEPAKNNVLNLKKKSKDDIAKEVIALLAGKQASMREIAFLLGYRSVPESLRSVLSALSSQGIIKKTGAGKNSKYMLS